MEAYDTLGVLSNKKIVETLDFIVNKMKNKDIIWRFDGGVNLLIGGIPRMPTDIDIRTDKVGYSVFKKVFSAQKISEGYNTKRGQYRVVFNIQGRDVEISYYRKNLRYMDMFERIIEKPRNTIKVPILSLADMRQFYERIGLTKKVKLIDAFLGQNTKHKNLI